MGLEPGPLGLCAITLTTKLVQVLYSCYEMAAGVDRQGRGISRYTLIWKLLSAYMAPEEYWDTCSKCLWNRNTVLKSVVRMRDYFPRPVYILEPSSRGVITVHTQWSSINSGSWVIVLVWHQSLQVGEKKWLTNVEFQRGTPNRLITWLSWEELCCKEREIGGGEYLPLLCPWNLWRKWVCYSCEDVQLVSRRFCCWQPRFKTKKGSNWCSSIKSL